jgi:hypothetical protein
MPRNRWSVWACWRGTSRRPPNGLEQFEEDRPEIARDPVLRDVLCTLISRKLALFPDDHRFILDSEITDFDDGPHLTVVSTNLAGPPQPPPG